MKGIKLMLLGIAFLILGAMCFTGFLDNAPVGYASFFFLPLGLLLLIRGYSKKE